MALRPSPVVCPKVAGTAQLLLRGTSRKDVPRGHRSGETAVPADRSQVMNKTTRASDKESSGNIFIDLGFQPHEAAVMLLRCELAEALRKWIDREGITQAQAAEGLGVAQPRISEISRNKVQKLSLDYLVGLCAKAGDGVKVSTAA